MQYQPPNGTNFEVDEMVFVAGVVQKFLIASMFMWIFPVAILYGFSNKMFPGSGQLSPSCKTLLSGFLAVISVNLVIVFYIIIAMREPSSDKHQPDASFLADAKASISQSTAEEREAATEAHDKAE